MSYAYMALFTGDYLRDTRHLTPEEHGIYLLLLMHCWDQRGPVPLDERKQAGIVNARSGGELESLRRVLREFFARMEDGWYNARMSREIVKCQALSQIWSEAGKRGAQAKAKPRLRVGQAEATTPSPAPSLSPSPTPSYPPIPSWLPTESWSQYQDHRKNKRAKLTPRAAALCFRTLEKLREKGQDPIAVIEQSIANGWTGLFPIQQQQKAQDWKRSEQATEAKARELGMWPARAGESWNDLRRRIEERLNAANN